MDIDNVTSSLHFDESYIERLIINNHSYAAPGNKQRTLNIKFDPQYYGETDGKYLGTVKLSIKITIPSVKQDDFLIDAIFVGTFSAESSTIKEDQFKKQVAINGGAALYSIARGKIEVISAASLSGVKIVIPFINVLDYYKAIAVKDRTKSPQENVDSEDKEERHN